jgi:hypothetical protein
MKQVKDKLPSIFNYESQWLVDVVKHIQLERQQPITLDEKIMLSMKWIWRQKHLDHLQQNLLAKGTVEGYLTTVRHLSFKGMKMIDGTLQTLQSEYDIDPTWVTEHSHAGRWTRGWKRRPRRKVRTTPRRSGVRWTMRIARDRNGTHTYEQSYNRYTTSLGTRT